MPSVVPLPVHSPLCGQKDFSRMQLSISSRISFSQRREPTLPGSLLDVAAGETLPEGSPSCHLQAQPSASLMAPDNIKVKDGSLCITSESPRRLSSSAFPAPETSALSHRV